MLAIPRMVRMRKATLRGVWLATAVFSLLAAGVLGPYTNEASALSKGAQANANTKSALRCYETRRNPGAVVCYRFSKKAEFRHGDVVFVPILIQVPVPADPPPVIVVDSLDDIHPSDAGGDRTANYVEN
ncbi:MULTISPECIES: hypothetical protein [Streptomyces]|uniref:hypothetical protein n=1 Tax=Streptomyces TaxID=1883 RepID=UPI000FFE6397|nr:MULTISPECIES: hypothetical protein [Streptomyces]